MSKNSIRIRVSNAEHHVVAKTANGLIFAPIKWCGIRNSRRHDYADKKYKHTNRFKRLLSNLGLLPVTLGQKSYHDLYSTYCKYCSRYGFHPFEFGTADILGFGNSQ